MTRLTVLRAQEECEVAAGTTMIIGYTAPADKVCLTDDAAALAKECANAPPAEKAAMKAAVDTIDATYKRSNDIQASRAPALAL